MDDADETKLFRNATRDVKPLRVRKKANTGVPRPRATAKFTRADQQAVLRESLAPIADPALLETGDEISFRRAGVPETLIRKLRRGQFSVDAEIDLHGLTGPQARHALREFLSGQIIHGARCVRVIHGKGLGSGPRGPVLKNIVNRDLRRMSAVIAFGSARHVDGGSGAVYVLLAESMR
ncbi:MAG: Smr/MutS family protein [Candidatus Obscuribacterales bacterium]|nr:Smr/MutS family protein [Steroidobacteraceae bacterium]